MGPQGQRHTTVLREPHFSFRKKCGNRNCSIQENKKMGPQGIEPRSSGPKPDILSTKLQAHYKRMLIHPFKSLAFK